MSQAYTWFIAAFKHMIDKKVMPRDDLKEKAGTTLGTISMVYNERRKAGSAWQDKVAEAYGYSLGDFILMGRDIVEGGNVKIKQITPDEMEIDSKAVSSIQRT